MKENNINQIDEAFKSQRILTNEQEKMLCEDYKINKMSYEDLSKKYAIKCGSVGWIINKYKI